MDCLAFILSEASQKYTDAATKYEEMKSAEHDKLWHYFHLDSPTLSDAQYLAINKLVSAEKVWDAYCNIWVLKGM